MKVRTRLNLVGQLEEIATCMACKTHLFEQFAEVLNTSPGFRNLGLAALACKHYLVVINHSKVDSVVPVVHLHYSKYLVNFLGMLV